MTTQRCMTHELWAGLNSHIFNYLRSITLAELVRQQGARSEVAVLQHDHRRAAVAATADRTPVAGQPNESTTTA